MATTIGTNERVKAKHRSLVPKTITGLDPVIGELVKGMASVKKAEGRLGEKVARLKKKAAAQIAPTIELNEQRFLAIRTFARATRKDILAAGKRSVDRETGRLGWRLTKLILEHSSLDDASVIKELRKLGMEKYIKENPSIDWEALAKDRDTAVKVGGTFHQRDVFYVRSPDGKNEMTDKGRKKKKKEE